MSKISRFSVSLEADLLQRFDAFCEKNQLATRSEAIRQLIHERLTADAWQDEDVEAAGTLTLVYDHHRLQVSERLTELQHDNTDLVISSTHAHLSADLCLEVILLRGPAGRLRRIASQLQGIKGIHKGELVMAAAGDASEDHSHGHSHG